MTDTAEREAFEICAKADGLDVSSWDDDDNSYDDSDTQWAWQGWQARAALPARAPEGFVLVPREPTPEMQQRGVEAGVAAGSRGEKWVGAAWAAMLSAAPPPPEQKEQRAPLKIEEGKFYRTRDGRKVGPARPTDREGYAWCDNDYWVTVHGFFWNNGNYDPLDWIAEWTDEPTTEPPASPAPGPAEPVARALEATVCDLEAAETLPRPVDLYYPVATDSAEGPWTYRTAGITVMDLRRILSALQPPQPAPVVRAQIVALLMEFGFAFVEASKEYSFSERTTSRDFLVDEYADKLSALQPAQPAPAPVAAQPQPSAEPEGWREALQAVVAAAEYGGNVVGLFMELNRVAKLCAVALSAAPPPASDERVAAMRERCAKVAELYDLGETKDRWELGYMAGRDDVAKAIRTLPLDGEG